MSKEVILCLIFQWVFIAIEFWGIIEKDKQTVTTGIICSIMFVCTAFIINKLDKIKNND